MVSFSEIARKNRLATQTGVAVATASGMTFLETAYPRFFLTENAFSSLDYLKFIMGAESIGVAFVAILLVNLIIDNK